MVAYLYQVHNLTQNPRFSKLAPETQSAILSYLTDSLGDLNSLESAIKDESDQEVLDYIHEHLDLCKYSRSIVFTTYGMTYVEDEDLKNIRAVIDFKRVNNIRNVDGLFREVNRFLPDGGIYIGRLETYWERKQKIYVKFGSFIGRLLWLGDFVVNRIIPRIPSMEDIYYQITNGEFHAMSRAEVLGRLAFCGFEVIDFKVINGLSYFVVMKTREPKEGKSPSYYPLIKLERIGKNGDPIKVFKFRTMHPYSEYIQDYVIKLNGYNDKGKPADDFRVTRWGKLMRKLWLDEVPQLINVLKGEMKIVGLRPLSKVRFDEFPEDLKKERVKYKPGCFPPYVALNMPDSIQNIIAERIYIDDLSQHPHLTDVRYLMKSVYNILANKIRSS